MWHVDKAKILSPIFLKEKWKTKCESNQLKGQQTNKNSYPIHWEKVTMIQHLKNATNKFIW